MLTFVDICFDLLCCQCVYDTCSEPALAIGTEITIVGGQKHQFCADFDTGMACNQPAVTTELETFETVDAGDGLVALVGGRSGLYCGIRSGAIIKCDHERIDAEDKFYVQTNYVDNGALTGLPLGASA